MWFNRNMGYYTNWEEGILNTTCKGREKAAQGILTPEVNLEHWNGQLTDKFVKTEEKLKKQTWTKRI